MLRFKARTLMARVSMSTLNFLDTLTSKTENAVTSNVNALHAHLDAQGDASFQRLCKGYEAAETLRDAADVLDAKCEQAHDQEVAAIEKRRAAMKAVYRDFA